MIRSITKLFLREISTYFLTLNLILMGKNNYVSKLIKLRETLDLCDAWRISNTEVKRFTFCQKHFSEYLHRRLDDIFISNNLKLKFLAKTVVNIFLSNQWLAFISEGSFKINFLTLWFLEV